MTDFAIRLACITAWAAVGFFAQHLGAAHSTVWVIGFWGGLMTAGIKDRQNARRVIQPEAKP